MEFKLRAWNLDDVPSLAKHINNIKIWNNVRDFLPNPYTEEDAREYILMLTEKGGPQMDFAIDIGGRAVGGIGLIPGSDVERISAELGYWLGEEYWGNDIMSEAVKQIIQYAFGELFFSKIFAMVFSSNVASMRVLEKVGFEKEAVLKSALIKNGVIMDFHYYSIIKK
ncbi:GNAT family N-acetyltransferase [Bacteroides ihuae]|uniref:GNAT family N-acetyltransferase n=1 Tax=Bacteroides ihuae TaxID=1852362 RepID=UPI0008D9BA84|nr:GNAT family protein [Bacteroides ihuae]